MHESWKDYLQTEFAKPYFKQLNQFLHQAYEKKKIFPPKDQVFSAFDCPLDLIKVVIIGQDPYHGENQAHGLAFSVSHEILIPPSLKNIFKELNTDLGRSIPSHGNLQDWADQGVLLLNNTLTVEANQAGSHRGQGWEIFTNTMISLLSEQKDHLVFLLWGRDARNKKTLINLDKHLVLEAAHPSPLSAYNGFFGCHHFSKTNLYLKQHHLKEINW